MIYHAEIYKDIDGIKIRSLFEQLPKELEEFIYEKIQNKIIYVDQHTVMLGNQFKLNWTYYFNNDIIHIRYKLFHCKLNTKKESTCKLCIFC